MARPWLIAGSLVAAFCFWAVSAGEELRLNGHLTEPPTRSVSYAQTPVVVAGSEQVSSDPSLQPIQLSAQFSRVWDDGRSTVCWMRGRCRIVQGETELSADQAIIWWTQGTDQPQVDELLIYLEGDDAPASVSGPVADSQQMALLMHLRTSKGVEWVGRAPLGEPLSDDEPVYQRAIEHRRLAGRDRLLPTQLTLPQPSGPAFSEPFMPSEPQGLPRHVTIGPRYFGQDIVFGTTETTNTDPPELVMTVTGGVNIVVDNVPLEVDGATLLTRLDLTADQAVIWTDARRVQTPGGNLDLDSNTPFQVYLEGNIIVRQGMNEIRCSHAFYDAREQRGLLMNAEVRTFISELEGFLRIRADRVRQLNQTNFHAQNAWVTTSQMGRPGYRIQADDIFLERRLDIVPAGYTDPQQPGSSDLYVTSLNNRLYLGEVPVFAAPYLSGPADIPQIPIESYTLGSDGVFGVTSKTVWNADTLLGLDLPSGVDWNLLTDWYSQRGLAGGTEVEYDITTNAFGIPGRVRGFGQAYYVNDHDTDNLGLDRRSITFPDEDRFIGLLRHRMDFADGTTIFGELGYARDRNLREQYFEDDFDREKDLETLVGIQNQFDNLTVGGLARWNLNDFENSTEWLPRGDLTLLGQPLLNDMLTWSTHSSLGYGRINPADAPFDPDDVFTPLPYYPEVQGTVAMTRHEIDMPLQFGTLNVVPYALGEVAFWEENALGDSATRLYGSAGVRSSIQFFKAYPNLYDPILGLNGLAHRVSLEMDYFYADSSEDLGSIAQYNEFDDDAQERFRERFETLEFGGALPIELDPRFYAVRTGAGRSVTAPYHELVDDMHALTFAIRQRWQTHVGPPDRSRITDWMTLDLNATWFPDASNDNFGEDFGLAGGRYTWNASSRTKFMANGLFDFFDHGQGVWNVGVLSQRSTRGSLYLGFRQVEAEPLESQLVVGSFTYAMSPRYIATFGTAFDIQEGIDRGQSLTISRLFEFWVLHMGLGYDRSRDNLGIGLSVEPLFGPAHASSTRMSNLLGIGP